MYILRGPDEKEHGPLSAREVREWIATGQATRQTLAKASGELKWRPLGDFIEFGAALEGVVTVDPPELPRPKTYRLLAIVSLIVSLVGFCGLPGIVMGTITLVLIKKRPRQFGGKRLAVAAIIIGILWPVGIWSYGFYSQIHARRNHYRGASCFEHVRSLVNSLRVVAVANNFVYPAADAWSDAIAKEVTSTNHFQCPDDPNHAACGYAYNAKLSGTKNPDARTVAIFESDLGWNGSGGPTNLITKPRHNGSIVVGLVNGQIRTVHTNEIHQLRWDP